MRISSLLPLAAFFAYGNSYKILVYNVKFGHSHSNFMGRIADILVEAGHNVTTLIPIMDESIKDGTTKSRLIHLPVVPEVDEKMKAMMGTDVNFFLSKIIDIPMNFIVGYIFGELFGKTCKNTFETPGLIQRLRDEKYDVYIAENFDMCGTGLTHLIGAKANIAVATSILASWQYDDAGVPLLPSFNPSLYTTHFSAHSILSRAHNLLGEFLSRVFFGLIRNGVHTVFTDSFGPDFPSFQDIVSRSAYIFTNAEPLIDFAHPTLHRVVDLGGLGAKAPVPVDKYWDGVLSLREKTVLLSFGSVAHSVTMTPPTKQAILQMVRNLPHVTFIWKYENLEDSFAKEDASRVENLVMSKWTPQNDLLNDPRVSVFISHGGMGSVQETSLRGVPTLLVPLFGDQPRNAAMMEHNGLGKVFDKFDMDNADKFTAAVRELIEDTRFRENAVHVSHMLSKKPFTPHQLLVKYTEFAAAFGASSALRPASHDMSLIAYHNLDLLFVSLLFSSFFLFLVASSIRFLLRRFFPVQSPKQKEE